MTPNRCPLIDVGIHPRVRRPAVGRRLTEPYRSRYLSGNRGFTGAGDDCPLLLDQMVV